MTPTSSASTYSGAATGMFTGALLALGRLELLLVIVPPALLATPRECQLSVTAYQARFQKPVVLMAQDLRGAPRYYGPTRLIPVLAAMPFELIPWRQFLYRAPTPWRLPIPPDAPSSLSLQSAALGSSPVLPNRLAPGAEPMPAATVPGGPVARHRVTLIAPQRELATPKDHVGAPTYRIDLGEAAGGARISQGTPPEGVVVRRHRRGPGSTLPLPAIEGGSEGHEDHEGHELAIEDDAADASEDRTVPIETVDLVEGDRLVEVDRWS